jgi:uncharacterized membrane protein YebE (DUF533 family)
MIEQEQKAVLTACLMAAFADGSKHERERNEIRNIAETLAGEASINLSALVQDVLLKRSSLPALATALTTPQSRQLAYEMAVCVCDADGAQSPAEREFLAALRSALGTDAGAAEVFAAEAKKWLKHRSRWPLRLQPYRRWGAKKWTRPSSMQPFLMEPSNCCPNHWRRWRSFRCR